MTIFITNFLTDSYILNGLVFSAFVLIVYVILTDNRFSFNRKIIFLILLIIFILISLNIDKAPFEIIKDLFWYSLVLNGSFIFHTLICDRIFYYLWKNNKKKNYEFYAFIISRISFTLSLSGIIYICKKLNTILFYQYYIIDEKRINYYSIFYYMNIIVGIIKSVLINFIIIFHNYSLLIMGLKKQNWDKYTLISYILQFNVLLIISIMIGIPRLYIIWFIYGIYESYNIFNRYYLWDYKEFSVLSFKNKIKYTIKNYNKSKYINNYYSEKIVELDKVYDLPYHKCFMFDMSRFLHNAIGADGNWIRKNKPKSPYDYLSGEDLIKLYCGEIIDDDQRFYDLEMTVLFCLLMNKDFDCLKRIIPELSLEEFNELKEFQLKSNYSNYYG